MKRPIATLDFLPDGTVQGLYTELIELWTLGQLKIERATTIEFDNQAQVWRVFDRKGRYLFVAPTRSQCLEWEQAFLTHERTEILTR